jgi:hypothetical protein
MRSGEIVFCVWVATIALLFGIAPMRRGFVAVALFAAVATFVALIWLER